MGRYVLRRLMLALPTVLGAVSLVFITLRLTPGDPAQVLLGDFATPESVAQLQSQFGLDQPIFVQYALFLKNMLMLDFGHSYATGQPVITRIWAVVPHSFFLAVGSMLVALIIGIPTGILAASSGRKWVDGISMLSALALVSLPNFYLGILLITVFSVRLEILPVTGVGEAGDPLSLLKHLILPSLALGGSSAAIIARMTRSTLLEVLSKDFITAARAKGLGYHSVVIRHALKNALLPVVAVGGLQVGRLLGGSIVIETVFARAGLGKLIVDSITARDFMLVQGAIVLLALIFVFVNLLTDVLYSILDPRIRYT